MRLSYSLAAISVLTAVGAFVLLSCGSSARIEIEAENFSRGDAVADCGEFGYGKGIGVVITLKPGAHVEYDFEVFSSGNYRIELRYASVGPRPLRLLIDGKMVNPQAADQDTGGFLPANQKWLPAGETRLESGRHTLRLECDGVFPAIDKIRLKKLVKIGG